MKRGSKLEHEVSVSELLEMRKTMSVKEIANCLDVSIGTIYRYIGKKSDIVSRAVQQNKPIPVTDQTSVDSFEEISEEETEVIHYQSSEPAVEKAKPVLSVLRQHVVRDLQGSFCVYHLDSGSNVVELKDEGNSTVSGILSVDEIPLFIAELNQILEVSSIK